MKLGKIITFAVLLVLSVGILASSSFAFDINIPPIAIAAASTEDGEAPLIVAFAGVGIDVDGTIAEYYWYFDDGSYSDAQNPVHIFTSPGTYHVTFTVTDNNGATGSDVLTISVDDINLPPVVILSSSADSGEAPLVVAFSAVGVDPNQGDTLTYFWTFGDGSSSNLQNPVHTYTQPSTYHATVTATDNHGDSGTDSAEIFVTGSNHAPTVVASASSDSGEVPATVAFYAAGYDADNDALTYSWDFGDGTSSDLQNPTHTYTQPSTYVATVTVTDSQGDSGSDVIEFWALSGNHAPSVVLSSSSVEDYVPATVAFYAAGYDADNDTLTYFWTFGDGTSSDLQNPVHTYLNPKAYTVTVTVTDTHGDSGSDSMIFVAKPANHAPTVTLTADPESGLPPLTVVFEAFGQDPENDPLTYHWDFGDGKEADGQNTVHTYMALGTYTATVTVEDTAGNTAYASIEIVVKLDDDTNMPPIAIANANPLEGRAPLVVSFTGVGIDPDGEIVSYYWYFGDGSTSNLQNPVHTYVHVGVYDATLVVTDDDGATGSDAVMITVSDEIDVPPIVWPIPDQTTFVNESYEYQVRAEDVDGDPLTYRLINSPNWLSIDQDGLISGIPPVIGNFTVTVGVSDGIYETTRSYILHVVKRGPGFGEGPFREGIYIQRVMLQRGEYIPVGEMLEASIKVANLNTKDLEDVRITVGVPDLGIWRRAGPFDIDKNDRELRDFYLEVPEWAQPGDYVIRIDVSNDHVQRVIHRVFTVTE